VSVAWAAEPGTPAPSRPARSARRAAPTDDGVVLDATAWLASGARPRLSVPVAPCPPPSGAGSGAGVRVALLAGAVDTTHPDLRGARVRTWSPGRSVQPAGSVRATAYATLLVGQGRAQLRGLVPAADLLVAPVLDQQDQWADEVVARAVRWAIAERAAVVVLPFGRQHLGRRLTTTLREAVAGGARVFAAAGDLGPDVLAFPASVTGVIAVTGHDEIGLLPGCSLHADLAAPGCDVPAGGGRGRTVLQGTAPAAVLAAGAYAARVTELATRWSDGPT